MKYQEKVARCVRLMIVRMQYRDGKMTREQALEVLKGPLILKHPETAVDDGQFLESEPEKIFQYFDLLNQDDPSTSNLEKHHTQEEISKMMFGDRK